jgi:hypothetical protein
MSAAATAAGYLYASGRLRGRGAREQEPADPAKPRPQGAPGEKPKLKKPVRVAVLSKEEETSAAERPKRAPRIEYRVRRWRPEQEPHE